MTGERNVCAVKRTHSLMIDQLLSALRRLKRSRSFPGASVAGTKSHRARACWMSEVVFAERSPRSEERLPETERFQAGTRTPAPSETEPTRGFAAAQLQDSANSRDSNRSKLDKDPAQWLPPFTGYWCTYVTDWIADQTVDTAEQG